MTRCCNLGFCLIDRLKACRAKKMLPEREEKREERKVRALENGFELSNDDLEEETDVMLFKVLYIFFYSAHMHCFLNVSFVFVAKKSTAETPSQSTER